MNEENLANLTPLQVRTELQKLAKEINYHSKLYYENNSPIISDAEFDKLVIRNQKLELLFPEHVLPESPSKKVGSAPANNFLKIEHLAPMLSLANVFSQIELQEFIERINKFLNNTQNLEF